MKTLKKPIHVQFVCHGNICRSPMAEFVFKDLVTKANLNEYFKIDSTAPAAKKSGTTLITEQKVNSVPSISPLHHEPHDK